MRDEKSMARGILNAVRDGKGWWLSESTISDALRILGDLVDDPPPARYIEQQTYLNCGTRVMREKED
jgi:hypothetical protein